ncbi:ATP-binding protein [Eubacterium xylanophilum]|uniref:ATP-binding protein n=1 Tax=Eubacterium xylanophilum TaxID=39497 RepID=UPI0004AE5EC0|nr:ATP-binding protein [Eubacterium xylanophilum]
MCLNDGIFVNEEEYSEFVRTEIVVNAVTHRDYGIKGTDIQIKMFDDRIEVDSPGTFAGMVKKENIRYTHFSRNPKIAAFLKDYGYVKEYGEGVDRMCKELESIGLPDPVFINNSFILKTVVMSSSYQNVSNLTSIERNDALINNKAALIDIIMQKEKTKEISEKDSTDAQKIVGELDIMQVIDSEDVMKILDCKTTKARQILKVMNTNKIIKPVHGMGKGKYMLNVHVEK